MADRDTSSHHVLRLSPTADGHQLQDLHDRGLVRERLDLLAQQVHELADTRHPVRKLSEAEKQAAYLEWLASHSGGDEDAAGVWIFYPWSGRLIRCLPAPEFFELRTSRNRNKITEDEQRALATKVIGVVGLSVGHASALTLAQEGVGGHFRLADFDTLDMSNLNRLKTFLHNVGLNKAVITAREMLELNPYLELEVMTEGITEATLEHFFDGAEGAPAIDLLVEECDDMAMKVRLRQEARRRRLPVLMETSDRGLLDVERYDLEPERPLLHGLAEGLDPGRLGSLSDRDKIPYVLRMVGGNAISDRGVASMIDVGTTLKTWPQLASAVALGGALITDTARRVFLGEFRGSGRFYVDVSELVRVGAEVAVDAGPMDRILAVEAATQVPDIAPPRPQLDDLARWLVEHASLAPSGGNCQPWRFDLVDGELVGEHDPARSETFLDYRYSAAYLALGAAAENIVRAGSDLGLKLEPRFELAAGQPARFRVTLPDKAPLALPGLQSRLICERVTNRQLTPRQPLDADARASLLSAVQSFDARLHLLESEAELAAIEDVLGEAERQRMLSEVMHRELFAEIRFTPEQTLETCDGIDVATLEMSLSDLAGLKLLSSFRYLRRMRQMAAGHGLSKSFKKAVAAASAIGLITVPGRSPASYFMGGRVVEAAWLEATRIGLAFQPLTASLYVINRLVDGGGEGLDADQRQVFGHLRARMVELFGIEPGRAEVMIFRVAKAPPASARALRLPFARIAGPGLRGADA